MLSDPQNDNDLYNEEYLRQVLEHEKSTNQPRDRGLDFVLEDYPGLSPSAQIQDKPQPLDQQDFDMVAAHDKAINNNDAMTEAQMAQIEALCKKEEEELIKRSARELEA